MRSPVGLGAPPRRFTVLGGTGQTGRRIVELALSENASVTVLARDPRRLGALVNRVSVVEGDALDSGAVATAIRPGTDAVFSAVGKTKGSPRDLGTIAMQNIVAAMRSSGVKRLVVLANAGVSDSSDWPSASQRVLRWLLRSFMRGVYNDSRGVDRVVRSSDLDWTIVRASILTNAPPHGTYYVGPMRKGAGVRISRSDTAEFMLKCATEATHVRECPYIARSRSPIRIPFGLNL